MKKNIFVSFLSVLVLSLSACVSSSRFKKMETAKLEIETQAEELRAQIDALSSQKEMLSQDVEQLTAEQQALQQEAENREKGYNELVSRLSSEVNEGKLQVRKFKDMLSVDVAEKIFFASGSASLKKEGEAVLLKVGEALANFSDKNIRVVGHTDNVPVSKRSPFSSNWELSVMRATTVVRFLQEKAHLSPESLIASGQGEYQPIASNETAEGRQKNRRIEIMLLDKSLVEAIEKSSETQ
ncbi:MAG: OmpA family protein [Elusimicrobia bacterium]|nr:OmpA family protein [Elusimicrobiota bacterium]